MLRIFPLLFSSLFGLQLFAQNYRPAYLITPDGERQEIELDDRDWADNPETFRYRRNDGTVHQGDVETVEEFGLADGSLRYQSLSVAIDFSGDHVSDLSRAARPQWMDRRVFLEVLVDGEADLFYWEKGERKRFFFRQKGGAATQLVDRRYLQDDRIVVQHDYLGQLKSVLQCETTDAQLYQVAYTKEDLLQFFKEYNACRNADYTLHLRPEPDRCLFLWGKIGGGVYYGSVISPDINGSNYERRLLSTYTQSAILEAEYVVPRSGGRWSLLAGVGYQRAFSRSETPQIGEATLHWTGIHAPLGVRRYFGLSPRTSAFVSALVTAQVTLDGSVKILRRFITPSNLFTHWTYELGGAAGVRHRRLSAELRYGRQIDILSPYHNYASRFSELNLMIGYRL